MAGYWIVKGGEIGDQAAYEEYAKRWGPVAERFGARILNAGGPARCPRGRLGAVGWIVEFPSFEQAVACYEDRSTRRRCPSRTRRTTAISRSSKARRARAAMKSHVRVAVSRRRGGRVQRALPPHPARMERRDAHRAVRADLRLHMACGGRLPHPERGYQYGCACRATHPALSRARGAHRPVLRAAPRGRAHPGVGPGPPRLPQGRTGQAPLHGARDRDCRAGRDRAALADHEPARPARGALRSARRTPRPLRNHPGVREGSAHAGGGDRAPQPGARAASASRRKLGRGDRPGHGQRRARPSTRRGSGRGRWARWPASTCRATRWSTSTSSPTISPRSTSETRSFPTAWTRPGRAICARRGEVSSSACTSSGASCGRRTGRRRTSATSCCPRRSTASPTSSTSRTSATRFSAPPV